MGSLKLLLLGLLAFLMMGTASFASAEVLQVGEDKIDMAEPPFWMSSYDEFKDLRPEQKTFYLEALTKALPKVPSLEGTDKHTLEEAAEWYQSWNILRRKLYVSCHKSSLHETCQKIAALRKEALGMFANKKKENREALGEKDADDESPAEETKKNP
ncbi:hypothetical protein [Bdellovibrio bacteriovorus]|uniref:hypothetical protein n=1 Tax=Bdellovibrio bacteriovorus TaxID=959 RepID=UPI0035A70D42